MAGKKQLAITERQFAALELLWEHGPLTVREVLARLPGGEEMPYTTVLGLLQGMERVGLVGHGDEQPAHRYRPTMTRDQATGTLLGDFVRRFFRGSAERLVLGLVDTRHLSAEDLRAIEEKIQHPPNRDVEARPSRRKKR
ncbi:MAG: putative transcriptional regulator [Gemmataceae bacterium]|nr:putative transcriptional regulator [Gemmataceae bacterium]